MTDTDKGMSTGSGLLLLLLGFVLAFLYGTDILNYVGMYLETFIVYGLP